MLLVRELVKTFPTPQGPVEVLKGVSFDLCQGESMALMGESGCGKSTLLHIIAGLEPASGGTVDFNGDLITCFGERERAALRQDKFSLIFQQFNLITSLTVKDNIAFEAALAGRIDADWIAELTSRLKLDDVLDRYPEELSGGQQQRVAVARTFAAKPALVLADEPTGNLDETNSDEVIDIALGLVRASGCSFLIVTHSERLAARADRTLRLSKGMLL
jgi:putative ABC transport system ATP-binding protein